jgi:hypothetical protein
MALEGEAARRGAVLKFLVVLVALCMFLHHTHTYMDARDSQLLIEGVVHAQ